MLYRSRLASDAPVGRNQRYPVDAPTRGSSSRETIGAKPLPPQSGVGIDERQVRRPPGRSDVATRRLWTFWPQDAVRPATKICDAHAGMRGHEPADDRVDRVVDRLDHETDFVILVVLQEERAEVLFHALVQAAAGGDDDRRPFLRTEADPLQPAPGEAAVLPRLDADQHRQHHRDDAANQM